MDLNRLIELAKKGHVATQLQLAGMYRRGHKYVVEKDIAEAMKWYQLAAESQNAEAMEELGSVYQSDKNDVREAIKWYKKAADHGSLFALYRLGMMYEKGKGIEKDEDKAFYYYKQAADQGDGTCQRKIAEKELYAPLKAKLNTRINNTILTLEDGYGDLGIKLGNKKYDRGIKVELNKINLEIVQNYQKMDCLNLYIKERNSSYDEFITNELIPVLKEMAKEQGILIVRIDRNQTFFVPPIPKSLATQSILEIVTKAKKNDAWEVDFNLVIEEDVLHCFKEIAMKALPSGTDILPVDFKNGLEFKHHDGYIKVTYEITDSIMEFSLDLTDNLSQKSELVLDLILAIIELGKRKSVTYIKTELARDYRTSYVPKGTQPFLDEQEKFYLNAYKQLGFSANLNHYQRLNGDVILSYILEKRV